MSTATLAPVRRTPLDDQAAPPVLPARRLAVALAAYYVVFVGVVTLHPFRFVWPPRLDPPFFTGPFDAVANVALFAPLGFLVRLARPRAPLAAVVGAGVALSVCVETLQLLAPERWSTVADVLTNGTGTFLGALLHDRLARALEAGTGRLALELPLVASLYLMLPLVWLDAAGARSRPTGGLPLLMLGLFAASVMASVQRAYLAPRGLGGRAATALAAVGWLAIGTVPAWPAAPLAIVVMLLLVSLFAWWRAGRAEPPGADRRFELRALLRAAPYYAAFLLLLPFMEPGTGASGERLAILHTAEAVGAFTLLGYLVAESRGRRELSALRGVAPALLLAPMLALLGRTLAAGGVPPATATLAAALAAAAAAAYGGWMYHLVREAVTTGVERGAGSVEGRP